MALKGTEALLRRSIYAVMPKRQVQQLEAITSRLGPVPVSRIEQIRREIMGIARELEEAGEIPFVSLDPLGKDFHLVDLGGQFPAYRRMSFQLVLRDPPGTHGGILFLYYLGVWQSIEEIGTLHQRYRMGVDLCYLVYRGSRKRY